MRIIIFAVLFLISFFSFSQDFTDYFSENPKVDFPVIEDIPFEYGEEIQYKIYYGIFTIGRGQFKIHKNPYRINNRGAYKIDVRAKTTGMVDWVAKIDDHWGGYVDTVGLVPHQAYRNIKEGNYRKYEVVNYDHNSQMLEVKSKGKNDKEFREPMYYEFPQQIRDLISGFAYFRSLDLDQYNVRDTINVPAFFEDTFYNLQVIYLGTETISTSVGDISAHKVTPVMPENKIFDGEDSVLAWFSNDKNKIPLKINAKLYVGSGGLEIISFKNVKYPINFVMTE
ncbi:DUF3108 domain-containing protein [Marivirga sp. S37H4]|uniref:DUF3108 domain-containing protein n=1 Tax=Marivirga aurantiaca TaxID=2802615 RepID=A0A934WWL0_9BACT|nr:DUF3108 domain-containing protein [Marivirga aurantiaca]MBK6264211.1 DUF3108 domain-containing protein [Marivirga aurantiaca]